MNDIPDVFRPLPTIVACAVCGAATDRPGVCRYCLAKPQPVRPAPESVRQSAVPLES